VLCALRPEICALCSQPCSRSPLRSPARFTPQQAEDSFAAQSSIPDCSASTRTYSALPDPEPHTSSFSQSRTPHTHSIVAAPAARCQQPAAGSQPAPCALRPEICALCSQPCSRSPLRSPARFTPQQAEDSFAAQSSIPDCSASTRTYPALPIRNPTHPALPNPERLTPTPPSQLPLPAAP